MISFNLKCLECEFEFEGWFESSNEYSKQKNKKLITCPSCDSHKVSKSLMAPNLSKKTNSKNNKRKKTFASNISKLKKMVEENFDYVGDKFTQAANKIKYCETKLRSIYG